MDKIIPPEWQAVIYLVGLAGTACVSFLGWAWYLRVLRLDVNMLRDDVEDVQGRLKTVEAAQTAGTLRDAVTNAKLDGVSKNLDKVLSTLYGLAGTIVGEAEARRRGWVRLVQDDTERLENQ